jgi:hypothetical protein
MFNDKKEFSHRFWGKGKETKSQVFFSISPCQTARSVWAWRDIVWKQYGLFQAFFKGINLTTFYTHYYSWKIHRKQSLTVQWRTPQQSELQGP